MAKKRPPHAAPVVTFWGATGTVTGSMHRVDAGGKADLLRDLSPLAGTTARERLVPGEPDHAEALAAGLRGAGFADVKVAERVECVEV